MVGIGPFKVLHHSKKFKCAIRVRRIMKAWKTIGIILLLLLLLLYTLSSVMKIDVINEWNIF